MQMQSVEIGALLDALSKAQAKMEGAKKDSANPFFKSKYADLSSVWEAAKGPLTDNGLSVIQSMELADGVPCLATILGHKSGQWIKSMLPMNPGKPDPQSMGSLITYYRRYALSAMVGICPEDDDGERASMQYRDQKMASQPVYQPKETKVKSFAVPASESKGDPTDAELQDLYDMIGDDREKEERMCDFYKVVSLNNLSRASYDHAIAFLQGKGKKEAKHA